jgi:peptidoglycan/xylan/chitin deacetylase (PgdA/CDA1 family)
MSTAIKAAGLSLIDRLGLFRLATILTKGKIRILGYHRFSVSHITPQYFEKQIHYLKKSFSIISLQYYLDCLTSKKQPPPNSVLLTVDDGYHDFYDIAFPILRKYDVPATLFLTVDFIDKNIWLWHDLLNFALKKTPMTNFTLNGMVFDLTHQRGKIELKSHLDEVCTSIPVAERDALIDQVLKDLRVTAPDHPTSEYAPLTWNQILEMSKFKVDYGAHTCTHPILTKIDPEEALGEIKKSKERIEEVTQKDILAFCYPNGKKDDFNENIMAMVRECGFKCAMSMIYGMNNSETDPYALRRMADRETFTHFVHDVSGFGELRRSLRKVITGHR